MPSLEFLSILRQAFGPTVTSYETVGPTVVQASADGYRLSLTYDSDGDASCTTNGNGNSWNAVNGHRKVVKDVFLKHVDAYKYAQTKTSFNDFRRTLMYLRTEVRFYNEILPLLKSSNVQLSAPEIYMANYNLDGIIDEIEKTTEETTNKLVVNNDPMSLPLWKNEAQNHQKLGGYIVMECINDINYYQDSPISIQQAKECLEAVAQFHASAWEDTEILKLCEERLSRGSYHLQTRNPKELQNIQQTWESFQNNFYDYNPTLFDDPTIKDIGSRVQKLAQYVSDEVSPSYSDRYATITHGDFKSMNCFLPKEEEENGRSSCSSSSSSSSNVLLVDFASTGVGLGMSDVAMHIHHAVRPEDLANGGEIELVNHYLNVLEEALLKKKKHGNNTFLYPRDVAMRHYKLCVVDYFRFVVGRFWKTASIENFEKQKHNKNVLLANRNVNSAVAFLQRASNYMTEIEQELV